MPKDKKQVIRIAPDIHDALKEWKKETATPIWKLSENCLMQHIPMKYFKDQK